MTDGVRNIIEALSQVNDHWSARRVVSINDYEVKVVKVQGEFVWHTHPETDELFLVISGRLTIQLRDGDVELGPNDIYVVPRGVEHCPRAEEETHVVLVEPRGTVNTGDAGGERHRRGARTGLTASDCIDLRRMHGITQLQSTQIRSVGAVRPAGGRACTTL